MCDNILTDVIVYSPLKLDNKNQIDTYIIDYNLFFVETSSTFVHAINYAQ